MNRKNSLVHCHVQRAKKFEAKKLYIRTCALQRCNEQKYDATNINPEIGRGKRVRSRMLIGLAEHINGETT